ncbi:MAG: hypothetical protein DBW74_02380 [Cryomorphaceae bacterium]|nr:MAG: hypothetical protein DBW74_02380 [Cryomorphaceae bacterium]|tara:strand:- start:113 stop:1366 length:1254 start_codon:yes stop_codon:yes gene_type:complete
MKKISLLLTVFLIQISFAQKSSYSPYSYFGVGETNFSATVENRMMGGNTSYYDSVSVNLNVPASLSKLRFVNYSVGLNLKNNRYTAQDNNAKSTTASLNYLSVSIPTKILGFNFGIKPNTSVGYLLESVDESTDPISTNRYDGDGGINSAFVGLGFELFKNFGIGISTSYSFGNLNHYHSKLLTDVELYTRVSSESSLSGLSYNFSAVFQQKFRNNTLIYSSFVYQPESSLTSKNSQSIATLKSDGSFGGDTENIDLSLTEMDETKFIIPSFSNFGIGFGEDKKWFFGVNIKSVSGNGYKNELMALDNINFNEHNIYSAGGFFLPQFDSFTSFFDRVTYRAGFKFIDGALEVNGQDIKDFGINFGLGLPVGRISKANIGLEFGQRGTDDFGLIKENYLNLMIGVSLNDLWFIRSMYN